jgi:hypothetical protein
MRASEDTDFKAKGISCVQACVRACMHACVRVDLNGRMQCAIALSRARARGWGFVSSSRCVTHATACAYACVVGASPPPLPALRRRLTPLLSGMLRLTPLSGMLRYGLRLPLKPLSCVCVVSRGHQVNAVVWYACRNAADKTTHVVTAVTQQTRQRMSLRHMLRYGTHTRQRR